MEGLKGMTVNERLFSLNKLDSFAESVRNEDTKLAIKILEQCGLTHSSALETVAIVFANPAKYGF